MRSTPLRNEHLALGARISCFGDVEVVGDYGIAVNERLPLDHPLLCDLSFQGLLRVSGKDSKSFLRIMLSCDIDALSSIGSSTYALVLSVQAEVIDIVFVICTGDSEYMLVVDSPVLDEVFEWLKENSKVSDDNGEIFEDIEIENETGLLASICLMGPGHEEILDELAGFKEQGKQIFKDKLSQGFYYTHDIGGIPFMMVRDKSVENSTIIWGSSAGITALWRALVGFEELQIVGFEQYKTIRQANNLWLDGVEEGQYRHPNECGLEHLLRPQGGFVGASALK